jgi:ribose transport system substrate-binding protein
MLNQLEERMKFGTNFKIGRRALGATIGAALLLSTAGVALADNANVKIGFTPKFLKDDFQTLMLQLSLKAFADKGMTVVGSPDPNGDIAAQVDALQNLIANGANVIVFAPLDSAGIVPAVKRANEAGALVFSIDDAPAGGQVTATIRADNLDAGVRARRKCPSGCRKGLVGLRSPASCWNCKAA